MKLKRFPNKATLLQASTNKTTRHTFRWMVAASVVLISAFAAIQFAWFQLGKHLASNFEARHLMSSNRSSEYIAQEGTPSALPQMDSTIREQRDSDTSSTLSPPRGIPQPRNTTLVSPETVIAAFDCARAQQALPSYTRESALDDKANSILQRILSNPDQPLGDREQGFTLTGQLMLDATYPILTKCMIGGFDVAKVQQLDQSSRIGVAIAPISIYNESFYLAIIVGY